ncbi:TPA: hypothetical protein EYG96_00640 [Candidatus Gracilibacteria bacterium]|nr:hypothetical protein [Candidatus Gracilibacteria bacterium]
MKLIRNKSEENGMAYILQTKKNKIGINTESGDMQIFLSEQKKDKNRLFHWAGEYEMKGTSFFLSKPIGKFSLGKIFVEGVRFVCFNDEGLTEVTDELVKAFGNTDILLIEKSGKNEKGEETGLKKADLKKLIEKVDPRVLIAAKGYTELALKEFSYPFQETENYSVTKASLPMDISEYIIL